MSAFDGHANSPQKKLVTGFEKSSKILQNSQKDQCKALFSAQLDR
jgi:hypothetical protein